MTTEDWINKSGRRQGEIDVLDFLSGERNG